MHVCLVGAALMEDPGLISRLSTQHVVTIANAPAAVMRLPMLATVDALVLEAGAARAGLSGVVADLCERHPELPVVLVNGGLDQLELADAFQRGITDYFAAPWNVALLAERIEVLATRRRTMASASSTTGGAP